MKKIVFFFPPKGPRNTLYDPRRRRGPLSRRGDNTSDFYTYRFGRAYTQQQQHHRYNGISLRSRSPETCTRYLVHGRGGGSGVAFQSGPSYRHAIPILNVSRSSRSHTYMSFDESFSLYHHYRHHHFGRAQINLSIPRNMNAYVECPAGIRRGLFVQNARHSSIFRERHVVYCMRSGAKVYAQLLWWAGPSGGFGYCGLR